MRRRFFEALPTAPEAREALDFILTLYDLKRFRAAATRYDKTATCYLAVLHVAFMLLSLR
ncbi:hypothetical protein OV208_11365 [Corallococcus sp. bb12-1]|uniref:hypothetical protein n=1 Tax=Corallococcus sp. bb12-1 TaxID=2996784 RepID=UPI002270D9FB|nr:hypothetical protein [Corallococcus sp. bb12-1]MCY1041913.1 hypothetical protein [Corallococcus sp. bb12-1]